MQICTPAPSDSSPLTLLSILSFRAAPMKNVKFVTSSSQPGQTMGSLNTPHPSWLFCAGWRHATHQTRVPWSSTAGVFFALTFLCHLASSVPQMTTADRTRNKIHLLDCVHAIARKHIKFFLAVSDFFLLFLFYGQEVKEIQVQYLSYKIIQRSCTEIRLTCYYANLKTSWPLQTPAFLTENVHHLWGLTTATAALVALFSI